MQIALCVNTDDPLGDGRIRIYHPVFDSEYDPKMPSSLPEIDKLPWARPISPFGGFDDSGSIWPPPAGSMVAVVYQGGNIDEPYYLGTIWNRHRGKDGEHLQYWYNYPYMDEYFRLYEGKRDGYNFGDNNGDQVHPPWNTQSYRQYDWDDTESFYAFLKEREAATTPNYYGMKTVGKEWLKFVDGDPKCNYKGRRIELATARGAGLFLKDDHLTPFSQYGYNGSATIGNCDGVFPCCESGSPTPLQNGENCPSPQNDGSCGPQSGRASSTLNRFDSPNDPFQKRKEENKYYTGVNTPAAYKVDLPQSGVFLISPSGNFVGLDDSVDQPFGVPTYDSEFNFGCNDLYKGKITIGEATGAFIRLNGEESNPKVRSENNGVEISTAMGTYIKLSDHTEQAGNACDCPPNFAGEKRGFEAGTTSGHALIMSDRGLKACGQSRVYDRVSQLASETGYTGYCMLRSGYGLQLMLADTNIQTETDQQFILLQAPQKDNVERGPHTLIMQEQAEGPGYLFLRAGGVMHLSSHDEMLEVVGTEDEGGSASKYTSITDSYLVQIKNYYFNHNRATFMWADEVMYLIAGQDCEVPENPDDVSSQSDAAAQAAAAQPGVAVQQAPAKFPCIYEAITSKDPWACPYTGYVHYGVFPGEDGSPQLDSRSHRVFVSAFSQENEDSQT